VSGALLLTLVAPALAWAQPPALPPAYEEVVERYARGDHEGAIAALDALGDGRLRNAVGALAMLAQRARVCAPCDAALAWQRTPVTTALMLHTDRAIRARDEGTSPRLHESLALEIAVQLKDDPERRAFAHRWFAAMAGLAEIENRWTDAVAWAEHGRDTFPGSGELLLVLGSIHETLGADASPRASEAIMDATARQTQANLSRYHEARDHLEQARRAFKAAVAANPTLYEATLRLGRVAGRLGETAEARGALEDVLSREPPREVAYLARLFVGRLEEDAGRFDEAARSYELAVTLEPNGQSARLALSHARLRLGDGAAARRQVEAALRPAGHRLTPDSFWLYPWGPSIGAEDRLEALRREASS
jgi:tetratricopeptide (TPR) repeat protein